MNKPVIPPLSKLHITSNRQKRQRVLETVSLKLDICLKKYSDDPELGRKYLLRLIFAQSIRAVNHVRLLKPTNTKDSTDERALIVKRISQTYADRSNFNIQQQADWLASIMNYIKEL
jgi:hypothetical protein